MGQPAIENTTRFEGRVPLSDSPHDVTAIHVESGAGAEGPRA